MSATAGRRRVFSRRSPRKSKRREDATPSRDGGPSSRLVARDFYPPARPPARTRAPPGPFYAGGGSGARRAGAQQRKADPR